MLVVKLSSGLGNQLFMLALLKYLETFTNEVVAFDTTAFTTDLSNRKSEIEILYPDYPVSKPIPWSPIGQRGIRRIVNQQLFGLISGFRILDDSNCASIIQAPNSLIGNIYFNGYWQNTSFIESLNDRKELFLPKEKCPAEITKYLDCIASQPLAVSIHVRRGDFYSNQYINRYAVCNREYYESAIKRMIETVGNFTLFVFSDDLEWVKQNLSIPDGVKVVFIENLSINGYWYIWLMAHCNHNIISNSTFSWWGAYLNEFGSKEVFCPDRWQLDSNFHLGLPSWTKIKVSL